MISRINGLSLTIGLCKSTGFLLPSEWSKGLDTLTGSFYAGTFRELSTGNYQFHHPSNPQQPIQPPYVKHTSKFAIYRIAHVLRRVAGVFSHIVTLIYSLCRVFYPYPYGGYVKHIENSPVPVNPRLMAIHHKGHLKNGKRGHRDQGLKPSGWTWKSEGCENECSSTRYGFPGFFFSQGNI